MLLAITDLETVIGGVLIWTLLVFALWLTRRLINDPQILWRRWRVGFFIERDPQEEPDLESGWDEDDTVELQHKRYPPKEGR